MNQDDTESIELPSSRTKLLDNESASEPASATEQTEEQSATAVSLHGYRKDSAQQYEIIGSTYADRYEVFTMLGKGGMSVVYKARHLFTKKFVALKILHPHLAHNEMTVKRFRQEAQTSGTLQHPGIISVQDFGVCDGAPYLVMDFIEGKSLSEVIKEEGNFSFDRFVELMMQVGSALDYAHRNQVIHRDLKPGNIMVNKSDGKEQAKIVDFGLAKVIQSSPSGQQLTQTGELFGSPLYMSPEQCSGRILDARSDIYAFGCVMYEALCGQPPFIGETVFETINKHLNSPPPPLNAPQLDDDIRQRVELLILKCLAKDVDARFASANDVVAELRSMKLSHGGGIFSRIQNSWNISRARRAARTFDMLPVLLSVALISCLFSLVNAVVQNHYKDLLNKRNISFEIVKLNNAMYKNSLIMEESGHDYVMDRDPEELQKFKMASRGLRKAFSDQEKLLKKYGRKEELKRLKKNAPLLERTVEQTSRLLSELNPGAPWSLNDIGTTSQLKNIKKAGVTSFIKEPKEEDETKTSAELDRAAKQLEMYSAACFALNCIVFIVFVLYYFRARKLRLLADRAAKLTAKQSNLQSRKGEDDITEIDSALEELAEALNNAEQREKALLDQIKSRKNPQPATAEIERVREN
ncbi:MAG: serine/threonine protein kinase [Candidatus Obscuribacterales bacterium]|jgi:serine/threonine protein kinase|nr:serine/threonine protein kinase [Candidatus Obscuribacterales bacterium]